MNEYDNIEYALWETDQELKAQIPIIKRRQCTPRVMEEVDRLLDVRNNLVSAMGELKEIA